MWLMRERATVVWVVLVAATCVSTWMFSKDVFSPAVAMLGTFLIAGLKVRFVMLDFMELRAAPTRARAAFEAWIVAVTLLILGFWFATPTG